MEKIGYSLVRLSDGAVLTSVAFLPCRLSVDGVGVVDFDAVGQVMPDADAPTHKLVERWATLPTTPRDEIVSETDAFDGTKVIVTREWSTPAPTIDHVVAERTRRLALGFDYDFGDARGVHHIGTTDADMMGWDEVAKGSAAYIALGLPGQEIAIVTNTGPAVVTALEFQSLLAAATVARQPLWAASFVLQSMNPIPADYADNSYWV